MKQTPKGWEEDITTIIEHMFVLKGYGVVKWAGGKELKEVTIVKAFIQDLLSKERERIKQAIESNYFERIDTPNIKYITKDKIDFILQSLKKDL